MTAKTDQAAQRRERLAVLRQRMEALYIRIDRDYSKDTAIIFGCLQCIEMVVGILEEETKDGPST